MKRKAKAEYGSMTSGIVRGVLSSIVVMLGVAAITAVLISSERISMDAEGYGACIGMFLSGFVGAFVGSRGANNRLVSCAVIGTIYWLALLGSTAVFFDGVYEGVCMNALLNYGSCLAACLVGARNTGLKRGRKLRI